MVANEYHFVFWMDASIRFLTDDLEATIGQARERGVLFTIGDGPVAMRTHPATFRYLKEEQCEFKSLNETYATFIIIYSTRLVTKYILKPWVSCALVLGCMLPDTRPGNHINCGHHGWVYHDCHRFDQSVLSILLYRLYTDDFEKHKIQLRYQICKRCITWTKV